MKKEEQQNALVNDNYLEENTDEFSYAEEIPGESELREIEESYNPDDVELLEAEMNDVQVGDPVSMYLKSISQYTLLTPNEEIELAKKIEAGRIAKSLLDVSEGTYKIEQDSKEIEIACEIMESCESAMKIIRGESISDEEKKILLEIVQGGDRAKQKMVNSNLKLVVSIAKKYKSNKMLTFLDLIQEGNIGLMRTTDKFDYRKGLRFSTYATWWIKQAITRAIMDQGRNIRIPVHLQESISKLNKATKKLTLELDREPSIEEVALEADISIAKAKELYGYLKDTESLDKPVGEDGETDRGTLISDEKAILPDENAVNISLREDLEKIMNILDERERKIIAERNGWYDGEQKTLEALGVELGITRERVRQIETRAMRKLKNRAYRMDLESYLKS